VYRNFQKKAQTWRLSSFFLTSEPEANIARGIVNSRKRPTIELVLSFFGGTFRARAKYDKISGGIREQEPEDIHDVVGILEEKQRVIHLSLYVFWKARGRARHKH
jgi:hypothetical protein